MANTPVLFVLQEETEKAQNKLSPVALTADQTHVFSLPTKVCRETDAQQLLEGKLFHARGPATAKFHVPSTLLVLETTRHSHQVSLVSLSLRLISSVVLGLQSPS